MKIQAGQMNVVKKYFPNVSELDCSVIAEGGSDNGKTFNGRFFVKIKGHGNYSFDNGELKKKV
jgi:hypothetical protein